MSQPSTIGNYAVLGELGRGGMGVVYRARHPEGQEVAIKVVLDPLEGEARARFEREAWACAQLAHPRLVRVLDVGVERGRPFLVLDFVRGSSLGERLKREGALEPDLACEIMAEVARGVAHAHAQHASAEAVGGARRAAHRPSAAMRALVDELEGRRVEDPAADQRCCPSRGGRSTPARSCRRRAC